MLALLAPSEVECFLAEAVRYAHLDELNELASLAVTFGGATSQRAALFRVEEAGPELLASLTEAPGTLAPIAGELLHEPGDHILVGRLLTLIGRRGDLPAMRMVAGVLRPGGAGGSVGVAGSPGAESSAAGPQTLTAPRIGRSLLAGFVRLVGRTGRRPLSAEDRVAADDLLLEIARGWHVHREPSLLLLLAIAVERSGPKLRAVLEDEADDLSAAIRGVSRQIDQPLVAANVIRWMGTDSRGRSAVRRLSDHLAGPDPARVLAEGHLLRSPRRRVLLRRIDQPVRTLDAVLGRATAMPLRARLALPVLISGAGLSAAGRLSRLGRLETSDPSVIVRLRAAEAAALLRGEVPGDIRLIPTAPGSADGGEVAGLRPRLQDAAPVEGDGDLGHLGDLGDLNAFARCLRKGESGAIVSEISRVRRRRLVPLVEPLLLEAVRAADARVASAAISALPEGRMTQRFDVIHEALSHSDPRVAANAVEAAGRLHRVDESVRRFVGAEHNRLRANAVRAMVIGRLPGAEMELKKMLCDAHPLHRISAIWVARVERTESVLDVLGDLSGVETVAAIRVRAQAAQRFLQAASGDGRPRPHAGTRREVTC